MTVEMASFTQKRRGAAPCLRLLAAPAAVFLWCFAGCVDTTPPWEKVKAAGGNGGLGATGGATGQALDGPVGAGGAHEAGVGGAIDLGGGGAGGAIGGAGGSIDAPWTGEVGEIDAGLGGAGGRGFGGSIIDVPVVGTGGAVGDIDGGSDVPMGDEGGAPGTDGAPGEGGTPGTGGAPGEGGAPGTGGVVGTGGAGTGGLVGTGGAGTGGLVGTGGAGTGGLVGTGGAGTGGLVGTGGAGTGGVVGTGGSTALAPYNCGNAVVPSGTPNVTNFSSDWDAGTKRWGSSSGLYGSIFSYPSDSTMNAPAVEGAPRGLHLTGTVAAGSSGGGGVLFLVCATVASFTSVEFAIYGSATNCNIQMQIQTFNQRPNDQNPPGGCDKSAGSCSGFPYVSQIVSASALSTSPTTVNKTLTNFTNWSQTSSPGQVVGLQWQFTPSGSKTCTVDVTLTNIKFLQ